MRRSHAPILTAALALTLALPRIGLGQSVPEITGATPAGMPEGVEIVAQVMSDAGVPVGEPLAAAEIEGGSFVLTLPDRIGDELLEVERFGCGEEDLIDLAYLPFLRVTRDGEPAGRLVLTDQPVGEWTGRLPTRVAYPMYVAEAFATDDQCPMGSIAVDLEPGWSWIVMMRSGGEVRISDDAPPEGFGWRYDTR